MRHGKTHVLISSGSGLVQAATVKGIVPLTAPASRVEFGRYDELTWIIGVEAVEGAPTAWSLGAKFQYRLDNTGGFIYSQPRWFDLAAENITSDVVEGVGWHGAGITAPTGGAFGVVADNSSTLPATVKRTLRNFPLGVRIVLDPQFTGGTNPGLRVNVTVAAKG